ncbi:MAG: alpha/beta fold hydrolase [Chthonomonadaceae bacterium]|nr:alpha/beta fold hydrolase [Chthonomonadaceae bacterium]
MKLRPACLILAAASFASACASSQIVEIRLFDGETLTGKLDLPDTSGPVKEVVVFIHGTGPGTYLDRRKISTKEFNYFDLFATEFNKRGIGFFSYSKRGVTLGTEPPTFETIDRVKFAKVVPSVEVKDIASVVSFLKGRDRLAQAKIVLLGWSEGTILAAMAAENPKSGIDALLLAGYANENLYDVIQWQYSGASSMLNLSPIFDADGNGAISNDEYASTDEKIAGYRKAALGDAKFEQLDVDKDGALTTADFRLIVAGRYKALLDAVQRDDDAWVWDNFFHVSVAWLKEHFALEANKTRLLKLDLPISIFHGERDANCPAAGVADIRRRFEVAGKHNLETHLFAEHNHDLNYLDTVFKERIPAGIAAIFDEAEKLAREARPGG